MIQHLSPSAKIPIRRDNNAYAGIRPHTNALTHMHTYIHTHAHMYRSSYAPRTLSTPNQRDQTTFRRCAGGWAEGWYWEFRNVSTTRRHNGASPLRLSVNKSTHKPRNNCVTKAMENKQQQHATTLLSLQARTDFFFFLPRASAYSLFLHAVPFYLSLNSLHRSHLTTRTIFKSLFRYLRNLT